MKILHVTWGQPPDHLTLGPVAYTQELCDQLSIAGHSSSILAACPRQVEGGLGFAVFHQNYKGLDIYGVTNRHVEFADLNHPLREMQNTESEIVLRWTVNQKHPDIIHFHNLAGLSASLLQTAYEMGIPFVVTLHNYWFICPRHDLLDRHNRVCSGPGDGTKCAECIPPIEGEPDVKDRALAYAARYRNIIRWLNKANAIIAVSNYVRNLYLEHGIAPERIITITPAAGTAEQLWATKDKFLRQQSAKITFGFLGTIIFRKGVHLLLDAAEMLHDVRDKFEISIHGSIADHNYAREIERRLQEDNRFLPKVEFAGYYKPDLLPHILGNMSACVVPPLWHEPAPRTVMEALGAGVPVVGARAGGIPEWIKHGKNGFLFEMGNTRGLASHLRYLIENPQTLNMLRSNIAPPKPMARHAEEIIAIYKSVMARHKKSATNGKKMRKAA
ncbi:MAG: glycosyltransferase [Armatimonadota bacterium]|nr:glycosyltransferase [Armatimonadota bacterium]